MGKRIALPCSISSCEECPNHGTNYQAFDDWGNYNLLCNYEPYELAHSGAISDRDPIPSDCPLPDYRRENLYLSSEWQEEVHRWRVRYEQARRVLDMYRQTNRELKRKLED
jgi:hypothetical protein